MSNNERERAVKRLKEDLLFAHETAKKHGGTADRSMFSVTDLRLLLSERAELLATVERMREIMSRLVALPVAERQLVYLDKGIGTKTPDGVWLEARAAAKSKRKAS